MRKAGLAAAVLISVTTPVLAQPDYGGLSLDSTSTAWQRAYWGDQYHLVRDTLNEYGRPKVQDLLNGLRKPKPSLSTYQEGEAHNCMRKLFEAPCPSKLLTVRQGLDMCLATLGIGP